eukprot:UN25252
MRIQVDFFGNVAQMLESSSVEEHIRDNLSTETFSMNAEWASKKDSLWLKFACTEIIFPDPKSEAGYKNGTHGEIDGKTEIVLYPNSANRKLTWKEPKQRSFKIGPGFDGEKMGIGGLDKQFDQIFRRAFASRLLKSSMVEKLGIKHVKGMLLHGPPGTGKTLIARTIGKMLTEREPKVVNGPEILNKFVGASEENIRKLFADARVDQDTNGDDADLHIIIFDEIDAICKARGSTGGGTGVHDTVVNQLLSMIDGVDSLNNILVIGMTNRKDLIDSALLRAGRLEVHLEIGLPDEKGRAQIFRIHTAKMRDNGFMGKDVDLEKLASDTKNYSGAEIEGVVKSATSYAYYEMVDTKNLKNISEKAKNMSVSMSHFTQALDEVKPDFGVAEDALTVRLEGGFHSYGKVFDR